MTFSGTIESDFMKLAEVPLRKRPNEVNFAATDFLTLRDSLLEYAKAVYPNDYNYFVESDLGMMFVEMIAYMGSVMSMKADMLANENFLATATQRKSVKKLLELIGVRMKGPLSSAADVRLEVPQDLAPFVPGGNLRILPADRVIETVSPEDGAALTYTLYKVVNGLADKANSSGDILLDIYEEGLGDDYNIFQNLVMQEGAFAVETGDFASTEGIKSIPLTQGPVVEGSVEVFITDQSDAGGSFSEVPSLYYASGSSDKVFEVVYDDSYNATIVFGDGSLGASPTNSASYTVTYRVGGGTRGNVQKNYVNAQVSVQVSGEPVVATATNVSKATGGANAESVERVKKYAPLTFRRQDRVVTLHDYITFSNTFISNFGTVGKATAATRKAYSSANVIDVYVLEKAGDLQLQKATTNFKTQLLDALNEKKMATDEVVIVDGLIRTLDLVTTIKVDREEEDNQNLIIAKVRDKVLRYFNADNREFGQELIIPELNRQIFEVEEVRYSTVDNLDQNVTVDFNEIIQLNNLTINIEFLQ